MINQYKHHYQRGQSAMEFLVIFPVLVLLVFGIIQFALLYQARATLNHATMLAARAGALYSGDKNKMRTALANGLTPLFAAAADPGGYAVALAKSFVESSALYTKIEILNPSSAALSDFGEAALDGTSGIQLPNDTLNYRTTTAGSSSKISIQDANILHIRVTYCVRLIVPVVDRILYATTNTSSPATHVGLQANGMSNPFGTGGEPLVPNCLTSLVGDRRIEIKSEAFVRMQSPFSKSNL